jgi:DNA modification methylase
MDPFTGLGSTAVACARLGLNFLGSELDESYLKEAAQRVREVTQTPDIPARGEARMKKATLRKIAARATA